MNLSIELYHLPNNYANEHTQLLNRACSAYYAQYRYRSPRCATRRKMLRPFCTLTVHNKSWPACPGSNQKTTLDTPLYFCPSFWPFMRNCSFRNSAKCLSHVGDISLSCVMCMHVWLHNLQWLSSIRVLGLEVEHIILYFSSRSIILVRSSLPQMSL